MRWWWCSLYTIPTSTTSVVIIWLIPFFCFDQYINDCLLFKMRWWWWSLYTNMHYNSHHNSTNSVLLFWDDDDDDRFVQYAVHKQTYLSLYIRVYTWCIKLSLSRFLYMIDAKYQIKKEKKIEKEKQNKTKQNKQKKKWRRNMCSGLHNHDLLTMLGDFIDINQTYIYWWKSNIFFQTRYNCIDHH